MRVAAIFGPGASKRSLRPFQSPDIRWLSQLPAEAAEADVVLILGGDGTVHRHLAELVRLNLPVLVVPCGSGNDFARALGLRRVKDAVAAWRAFAAGKGVVKRIDLGVIRPLNVGAPEVHHYFCTVAGIGLSSEIARRANRLPRWLLGHGGYALSLPPTLLGFRPFGLKISAEPEKIKATPRLAFLAAFANGPAYGGGMKIAPRARLDDGRLDVCIVAETGKMRLFCLFPTVYFGRHLELAEVQYSQGENLRVETEPPLEVYADGEHVCQTPAQLTVAREALRVIVNPGCWLLDLPSEPGGLPHSAPELSPRA
ncbi:MAG TPA: diacylglycerol kinase family protein [Terriglobales bacterium]|nr:diacylglycerol kinase family protein [Terriglobales bacterium]